MSERTQKGFSKPVKANVDGEKFQDDQQIVEPVKQSVDMEPAASQFNIKKSDSKGSQLKQEAVSKVITGVGGDSPAAVSMAGSGLRSLAYSGNEGTILGSASGTPNVDRPSRSDTRPGQKMDAVVKLIDFAASEQVTQEYDESVPLQNDPTAVQGDLGHPDNINARNQKTSEAVPGGLLFQRSADEIANDQIAYSAGQVVREQNVNYAFEPTQRCNPDNIQEQLHDFSIHRGNYVPKAMRVGIDATGHVVAINYDVDNISCENETADIVNEASCHFLEDMNNAEINRQNIETKAGNENDKNWSALARANAEPTPTVGFLTDDELITGSENFMAYRFLTKAWGYLLNKVAKDGQVPYRTFREALYGYARAYNDAEQIQDNEYPFTAQDYLNGAPSLMIPLYDSIAKYCKRGDLFTQPRGWKLHKQTADNNINQFRIKPEFAAYIKAVDTFSTIDRGYDPLLPVCITDGFRIAHPYSFADLYDRRGGSTHITKIKGKGVKLASTVFTQFVTANYDATTATCHTDTGTRTYKYSSGSFAVSQIYDDQYSPSNDDSRKAKGTLTYSIAPDMSDATEAAKGFDTYEEGLASATQLMNQLKADRRNYNYEIVILFRVTDTGADDVYAVIFLPNIYNTTANSIGIHIQHSTTLDDGQSDMTAATNTAYANEVGLLPSYGYSYHNKMNWYYTLVQNPLLYGIAEWLDGMGYKMRTTAVSNGSTATNSYADSQGILWYYIPIAHYTRQISLWDLIVCATVKFQQKIRTNSQYDTFVYMGANGEYPYKQLVELGSIDVLGSPNYVNNNLEKPLGCGTMQAATSMRWVAPEKFWRIAHGDSTGVVNIEKFVLPFYFSEEQFNFNHDTVNGTLTITKDVEGHVVNHPSIRSGARLSYLDKFYSMKERDIRLIYDRMVRYPGPQGETKNAAYQGVYKYSSSASGIPVICYDTTSGMLTLESFLKTPREIGWGMTAPIGYVTPATNEYLRDGSGNHVYYVNPTTYSYSMLKYMSEGSSFRIRTWRNNSAAANYPDVNANVAVAVNRAANFAQKWREQCDAIYCPFGSTATYLDYGTGLYFYPALDIGIAVNMADAVRVDNGTIIGNDGDSSFYPFTYGNNERNNQIANILSLQKIFWTKIQQLPFALSPFDQTPSTYDNNGTIVITDATCDPYDLMYIFGFCGFKGSDYREDVFNRIYEKQTLGWQFNKDPYTADSALMKSGGYSA